MKIGKIIHQGKTTKGHNIVVRYPTKDDTQTMCDYINTLSKEQTFIRFQGEQVSLEDEIKYLDSFLEKIEKQAAVKLLAFHKDKLIGASDVSLSNTVEKHVGVFGITIAKEFRGQGIGKLLMKLVLEEAKNNLSQLKIVTLGVFANNSLAIGIYKKFGFIEYGKLPKGIKHRDDFVDHVLMYKEA